MKFLKKLAKKYPALARGLEISIISSLITGAISLLDAINAYFLQGTEINLKMILSLLIVSLVTGITAGLTKFLRDRQKELDPETDTPIE